MDVGTLEFWKMFGAALLSGGIIGLERQIRGKPSGIRTSILICLGTALFVSLGKSMVDVHTDPTRVLGQVVTGIGFLGAGVIVARGHIIAGVTSAAAIWILAAIGAMIMPSTLSILVHTFRDPKERAQAVGVWTAVFFSAPVSAHWWADMFWNISTGKRCS